MSDITNERFDYLLRLTGTTNTAIGREVSYSPSYISKIRSGTRAFPSSSAFRSEVAAFLSKRVVTETQREKLQFIMKLSSFPTEEQKIRVLIENWLYSAKSDTEDRILASYAAELNTADHLENMEGHVEKSTSTADRIYFGIEGEREGAIRLMRAAIEARANQTVMIYSDVPNIRWITDDPSFRVLWINTLRELISTGNQLIIMFDMNVEYTAAFYAIQIFYPLILTGKVQLKYIYKLRDHLFTHTYMVAPSSGVLMSCTIDDAVEETVHTYCTNPAIVLAYEEKLIRITQQYRSVYYTFDTRSQALFWKSCERIAREQNDLISYNQGLSALTMPTVLLRKISERCGAEMPEIVQHVGELTMALLENHSIREIVLLPSAELVVSGNLSFPLSCLIGKNDLCYTVQEYVMHLKNIVFLLQNFPNYHVYLLSDVEFPFDAMMMQDSGMIVATRGTDQIALAKTNTLLEDIFQEEFSAMLKSRKQYSREETVDLLLREIKSFM